eukprot:389230-Prymnesium_polylepis.1
MAAVLIGTNPIMVTPFQMCSQAAAAIAMEQIGRVVQQERAKRALEPAKDREDRKMARRPKGQGYDARMTLQGNRTTLQDAKLPAIGQKGATLL